MGAFGRFRELLDMEEGFEDLRMEEEGKRRNVMVKMHPLDLSEREIRAAIRKRMMQGAAADGEAVDFEPEDDDLMDEDGGADADATASPNAPPLPKLKSAITGGASSSLGGPKKTKGRGFRHETDADRNTRLSGSDFDSLTTEGGPGPQRC
ncbi:RNA-binding protein Y14 [Senna tora]|uniref:RNA-binding protein Y14 n=1 Tax=Senna tora TaxID=362788 RepID=A0A834TV38_9FABA|nr:RNA-binding protein Y14 [Senna tora]